ncbi:prophage regulatory protein AlpA [Betaproteobacteria bacterium]|nr:prophage regulatory protein AlpA [Betaproteobacteria bacterium]
MAQETQTAPRIISRKAVTDKTRLPCSSLYERINPKNERHDPTFPRPIRLGARAVGWVEAEIDAWIAAKIQESRTQPASKKRGGQ